MAEFEKLEEFINQDLFAPEGNFVQLVKQCIKKHKEAERALWMARARNAYLMSCKEFYNEYKHEHPHSIWNDIRPCYSCATSFINWCQWFQHISITCIQKAKEFE